MDATSFLNLIQLNNILNKNNKMLDLVLCNKCNISKCSRSSLSLVPEDEHHPSVGFLKEFLSYKAIKYQKRAYIYDLKRENYALIIDDEKIVD